MELKEVLNKRKSIRSFKEKEIEEEKLNELFELMNLAPSAGNLQAFKVKVIKSIEMKKKLFNACLEQESILEAPVCLVFIALPNESAKKYGERGTFYSLNDAIIAAAFTQLIAVDLGLSSVWIGAFEDEKLKKELKLKENELPVCVLPLGYANEKGRERKRKALNEIIEKE